MKKRIIILNYGSIAGLLGSLLYISLFKVFNLGLDSYAGYIVWPVVMFLFYKALVNYRDEEKEGFITYQSGVLNGFFFSLIYASLVTMIIILYNQWDASYIATGVESMLSELGKTKETYVQTGRKDEYEMIIKLTESYGSNFILFGKFFSLFFANAISSLVIAFFVKTGEPPIFAADESEA